MSSLRKTSKSDLFFSILLRVCAWNNNRSHFIDALSVYPSAPVIGVLSQPHHTLHNNQTEYIIAASYIKWLEAGGARSIPIPYDAPDELVDEILQQVNGVLFPGGGSPLPPSAWKIWNTALELNDQGDFFPIWGTCLGFEYLIQMASLAPDSSSDDAIVLEGGYDAENVSWPLIIDSGYDDVSTMNSSQSRLYSESYIQEIVITEDVAMNNHIMGVRPSVFESNDYLSTMFRVTSMNLDRQGKPFVSSIESDFYPFYGVQYHPEKNPFEYATYHGTDIPYESINHSPDSIHFSLHLANFFVNVTRQNMHTHTNFDTYPPVNTYEVKRSLAFQEYFVIPSVASMVEMEIASKEKSSQDEDEANH